MSIQENIDEIQEEFEEILEDNPFIDKLKIFINDYDNLTDEIKEIIIVSYYNYLFDNGFYYIIKDELKELIKLGLDINKFYKKVYRCESYVNNALTQACEYQSLEVLKYLIENGGDVNIIDKLDMNLCEISIIGHGYNYIYNENKWSEICKYIISKGGDVPRKNIISEYLDNKQIKILDKYLFY